MSIIKITKRENPFVQIDKEALRNPGLSWKAKGILSYLLSLPVDWQLYINELKDHATDGRDSTSGGINELIKAGYITRKKKRTEGGRFEGYEYFVFETPQTGTPETDKPQTENPFTDKPKTVKPNSGNPELLIIEDNKKDKTKKENNNGKLPLPDLKPPSFDEFWHKYQHKKNKKQARASWSRLKPQDKIDAVAAIPQYLKYLVAKTHPQCHASTWLNNRRWEDDNSTETKIATIQLQPDNYKLSDNLENLYKDSISKYNKKEVSSRISYFNKQEFEMWMPNGKYFEMYRDRQYLAKDIYKKITDTINLLNTSSFFKNHRGQLNDFVIGVFKGQIKVLA